MGSIQDFQGRLTSFVESQYLKIYDDQLAIASQIWDGLSSEEHEIPQVTAYIAFGVFQQLNRSTGIKSTKRMIRAHAKVDERFIHQIKKMALIRGLDRWQSSGKIAEAKQRIIAAYEQDSVELNLSFLHLTSLPAEISQLTALERLNLAGNYLQVLPLGIGQLTALTHLNLSYNELTALPAEICQLTALQSLDLGSNKLMALPAEIGELRALTDLRLSRNQLTDLPAKIGQLIALSSLDLSINRLRELPAEIGQLKALTRLVLSHNQLTALPAEIGQLRTLTYLTLFKNELTDLPAEIWQLRDLTFLDLSNNLLRELPAEIWQLRDLTCLNLSNNRLRGLPAEIGQLTALINLVLTRNQLTVLPAEIGQLRDLTYLNLSNNRLRELPAEIGQLIALTRLVLASNQLTVLPAEIGQLRDLIHLELSHNQLTALPAEIGQLRALTYLTLFNNELRDLPAEMGQLRGLISLYMSDNRLINLPPEIGQLSALTNLDLSNNQLRMLPFEIGQLRALIGLYIFNNQLTSLPLSIGLLTNIQNFVFHHNPLRELPLSSGELHLLTDLDIEGTQIDVRFAQAIFAQCEAKRDAGASTLLPMKLAAWKALGESDIDLSLFDLFTDRQKFDLFEWLVRLEKTRDFSNNQKSLAAVVCDILKDVLRNEEFQEIFFVQVEANNQSFEDRAAISFNEICVSWKIICLSPDETLKEKLLLLASAAKIIALRRFLDLIINKREGQERESVEIYLYYELSLKNRLQLFTAIDEMRDGQIGQRDWINEDEIIQYVEKSYFIHLFDSPLFRKLFDNNLATQDKIQKINEFYQAKLETTNGTEQLVSQEEKKQALIQWANEWFDTLIGKQNLKRPISYVDGEIW